MGGYSTLVIRHEYKDLAHSSRHCDYSIFQLATGGFDNFNDYARMVRLLV